MGRFDNLVDSKNYTIRLQQIGLILLSVLLILALLGWSQAPKQITLHYPPDLTGGVVQTLATVPKANVYSFTFYVFQQLNRWPDNGTDDYFDRIHALRNYTTPACFEERLADYEARERNNELTGRSRAVWEIPGRGFSLDRVKTTSSSSWMVGLDLHVQETFRGERIKDRLIHFPISVVRYDVDKELNPWGLAIDCYAGAPRHIQITDENTRDASAIGQGATS